MLRLSWAALEEGVPELSLDDFACKLKFEMSKMAKGEGENKKVKKERITWGQVAYVCKLSNLETEAGGLPGASLGCTVSSKPP